MKISRTFRRVLAGGVVGYGLLLAASTVWRMERPVPEPGAAEAGPGGHWRTVEVARRGRYGERLDGTMRLRVREVPGDKTATPVLLIHGSPLPGGAFDRLRAELGRERTLWIPDLPGMGWSREGADSRSIHAQGVALAELLECLGADRVHVAAYCMGGGAALHLWEAAPQRVVSLSLISSIGVQEYELTGDYHLNHLLHGAQLAVLWPGQQLIPHFGKWDDFILNTDYAWNFYESDQRPLRGLLERYDGPALVVHARDDVVVPAGAAREHLRLMPQAEGIWLDGGHGFLFTRAGEVAAVLEDFWRRVEQGRAATRATADPERVVAAREPFDTARAMRLEPSARWVLLGVLVLATFLSEDLTCLAAGLLAGRGLISVPEAMLATLVGIVKGDMGLYVVGRMAGAAILERKPFKQWISKTRREEARVWLTERTVQAVFLSRFIPGLRLPTYLLAGVLRVPALKMTLWFLLAGVLWTVGIVGVTAWLGRNVWDALPRPDPWLALLLLLGSLVLWWICFHIMPLAFTVPGRRLLLSRWRRFTCWEFWPPWAVYPPVVAASCLWAWRYGGWTVFSAVNPGIPHGGWQGESKSAILRALQPSGSVARFVELEGSACRQEAWEWMEREGLDFPVVLKPDSGERGRGVRILRNREQFDAALAGMEGRWLLQEHVGGAEFGIFHIRHPERERGRIFSATRKRMTEVAGDGVSSLEQLILADDRAVCSAEFFLAQHAERLAWIPAAGERVELTELGTHCRGALFLDGMDLVTPELEAEVERIARNFEGFHFGRFDIRAPSEESLKRGEGLRVLELNGVTSEAVHIYHPGTPWRKGIGVLLEQWRLAYEIGAANAKRGARVTPWWKMAWLSLAGDRR